MATPVYSARSAKGGGTSRFAPRRRLRRRPPESGVYPVRWWLGPLVAWCVAPDARLHLGAVSPLSPTVDSNCHPAAPESSIAEDVRPGLRSAPPSPSQPASLASPSAEEFSMRGASPVLSSTSRGAWFIVLSRRLDDETRLAQPFARTDASFVQPVRIGDQPTGLLYIVHRIRRRAASLRHLIGLVTACSSRTSSA